MTFYLKPPLGAIPLHRLLGLAETRLNFLLKISELHENEEELDHYLSSSLSVQDSECLIENNVKDRISHFILRLSCASREEMASFFLEAESILFRLRLKSVSSRELLQLSHELHRQTSKLKSENSSHSSVHPRKAACLESLDVLHDVSQQLKAALGRRSHLIDNHEHIINVPFQFILPLVANRSVRLTLGYGLVPLAKASVLLEILFKQYLTHALEELKQLAYGELFELDPRIEEINREMTRIFIARKKKPVNSTVTQLLHHTQIDQESLLFPLCMRFLHERLRQNHRLKHLSRIQYTLYLKEIGLPVNEAINFWELEYSKSAETSTSNVLPSSCCHNWQRHGNRYRYSIRHLYGLEGSRRPYSTHSCQQTQLRVLGPLEEAGCPFQHFDQEKLRLYLKCISVDDGEIERILSLVEDQSPSFACDSYMKSRISKSIGMPLNGGSSADMSSSESGDKLQQSSSNGNLTVQCDVTDAQVCLGDRNSVGKVATNELTKGRNASKLEGQKIGQLFSRPSEFYFVLRRSVGQLFF